MKLAIVSTHPIQYNAPFFAQLAQSNAFSIKVFYTWGESVLENKYDPEFKKIIEWDIPLLENYDSIFVKNIAKNKGSNHFWGIQNPTLNADIEAWGADALLIYGWSFLGHLQAMRHFKGRIPVFFRGDSHLLDQKNTSRWKKALKKALLTNIYRSVDYALYVGTANKNYFLEYGLTEKQLIFVPHAIDNQRFKEKNETLQIEAKQWRTAIGIAPTQPVFLFVGKFSDKKNPLLLLRAAKHFPEAFFLFVGNGILEKKLKEEAQELTNVGFLPFQNQSKMPLVYRLGNILVLSSQVNGETWGLAVNEAMACGLPVVVSNRVGCAADLVQNDKNGYVFATNNLDDLLATLKKMLDQKQQWEAMGAVSEQIIAAFSYQAGMEALENLFKNA